MDVTVAICTWNRADLLERTLARMQELIIPRGLSWELLIVNNCCTDDTNAVIARHEGKLPLRRLDEPKQGLSNARNCAMAAAQGDLLIWTDDDVLVDPGWLEAYVRAAQEWPQASFFGGVVDPWFSKAPPRWITRHFDKLKWAFVVHQLGNDVRLLDPGAPLATHELPLGANMAFRTNILRKFPFNPKLGRLGSKLYWGEETEVIARMREAGHAGVWVGTARVLHYIPAERLTARYFWNWVRDSTEGETLNAVTWPGVRLWGAPRWMWRAYLENQLVRFLLTPFRNQRWLDAFVKAAQFKGIINAERKRSLAAS
jgi:glycosyltransferase involved in cell wall biosynthesis